MAPVRFLPFPFIIPAKETAHDGAHRKDRFHQLPPYELISTRASSAKRKLEDVCISHGDTTIGSKYFQPSRVVNVVYVNSILNAQLKDGEAGFIYK